MDTITNAIKEYFNVNEDELTAKQRSELSKFLQTKQDNVSLLLHQDDHSSNSMRFKTYTDQRKLKSDLSKVRQVSNEKLVVFVKLKQDADLQAAIINEDEVVNHLLQTIKNDNVILNILNELQKYGQLDNVQQRLKPEREQLINRIVEWANNCVVNDNDDENAKRISKLTINKSKIRSTLQLSNELLKDLDEFHTLKRELEQIERELNDECDLTFKQWCDQCSSIDFNLNKQCIEFDEQTQIPFVTYDKRLIEFMDDCRLLSSLNYKLPEDLVQMNRNALNYAEVARELSNIINFYCSIGDQILISQRAMLIEPAKRFTSLLSGFQTQQTKSSNDVISWSQNEVQLKKWLDQLRRFCDQFENENRNLRRYHQNVLNLLLKLFDLNIDQWSTVLNNVNVLLLEVDQKYSNSYAWRKHWNVQLFKVLNLNFKKSILNCESWLGKLDKEDKIIFQQKETKFKIDLIFTNRQVVFRPSLEQVREKLYKRINRFLNIPIEFKGLVASTKRKDPFIEQLYRSVLNENQSIIFRLYQHAELILNELNAISNRFVEWTGLYSVVQANSQELINEDGKEENKMLNEYLNSLDTFKTNLLLLKSRSQKFNKEFIDNELNCTKSNILINLSPIKVFVDWVHLEMDKILVRMLSKRLEKEAELIRSELNALISKFNQTPTSIEQLREFETLIKSNELASRMHKLNDRYDEFESKQSFIQKWSADNAINLGDLNSILNKLQKCVKNKDQYLGNFKQEMHSKINDRCNQLMNDLKEFNVKWKESQQRGDDKKLIDRLDERYQQLDAENEQLAQLCEYFNEQMPNQLKDQQTILDEYSQISGKMKILNSLDLLLQPYYELEWLAARNKLNQIAGVVQTWCDENLNNSASTSQLSKTAKQDTQDKFVQKRIDEMKSMIQILKLCKGEFFARTHWEELFQILELNKHRKDAVDYENLKLADLMMKRDLLIGRKDEIRRLNERALSELSIREALVELDLFSEQTKFDTYDYRLITGRQVKLIKNWHNVTSKLSECLMTIHSLKSVDQLNNNELAEKVSQWEQRLFSLDTIINLLNKVQRKYTYLEPIYTKNTIEMLDQNSFEHISSQFLSIMNQIVNDSHVIRLVRIDSLDTKLAELNSSLSNAQKKLIQFMEQSRDRFPRFYFLSDDDLLLILAGKIDLNTSGLLRKLFNNCINRLSVDDDRQIYAIESIEGELIKLNNKIRIVDSQGAKGIEQWLMNLNNEITSTLKGQLNKIVKDSSSLTELIKSADYCNQIVLLKNWLDFTRQVESAITNNRLNDLKLEFEKTLNQLTNLDSGIQLNGVQQIQIKSLILDTIHFVAVIDELIFHNVHNNVQSWHWQKQLRYYSPSASSIEVCMGCSNVNYSFEYLGCYNKLVHTPLTDVCFLTCMQALTFGLGGNPFGKAGTGKTESIKALGAHLGRQVLVFNCDEALDLTSITRILIGLVKCGFWGCFDEFNRLQLNVLSALSTHIATIQNALKLKDNKNDTFKLQTSDTKIYEIKCNYNASLFVTLNPAGKQYKARNRLPENLKALFLPIAMQSPEIQLIATVILLAEGFNLELARNFGRKIHVFFTLARQSFSKQVHYDWGLRAIKSCLNSAGRNLKLQMNQANGETVNQVEIFITSMNAQLKPKLVLQDDQLYNQLLNDVFGYSNDKSNSPKELNREFRKYVEQAFVSLNLIKNDEQLIKVIELNEQVNSRLGVVLIGESGVGKSTIWKLLIEALKLEQQQDGKGTKEGAKTFNYTTINPKAIDRDQLLGYIDPDTNEWFDGLFSMKVREIFLNQTTNGKHYIIFDGEIDPFWVEALNSVLDDNQVLTLPTGERIDFDSDKCSLLFETTSLKFASPATISRLGIICVSRIKCEYYLSRQLQDCKLDKQLSLDDLARALTQVPLDLKMSRSRTLITTIKYCATNQFDLKRLSQLKFELPDQLEQRPDYNDFCVTKNRTNTVNYCEMLMKENEHFILFGPAGSGKQELLKQLTANDFCLNIDCVPDLNTSQVLKKLKKHCTLISHGANKVLKSPTGGKLILLVKHLELLEDDEWQCKQLVTFLTGLLTYNGCFDLGTGEWIEFHNYQLICTCLTESKLSNRFLNLVHIINLEYTNLEELNYILNAMLKKVDQQQIIKADWNRLFIGNYTHVLDSLINGLRNNKYELQIDLSSLDALRNGRRIIDKLKRYEHLNERSFIREIYESLFNQLQTEQQIKVLNKIIKQKFALDELDQYYLTCDRFDGRLLEQDYAEFEYKWRSIIDNWCNENEYLQRKLCLTKEFLNLLSSINCFLCDKNENRIQALFLLAAHGTGRKLFTSIVSNHLSYDKLWTIEEPLTNKQLTNEIKSLFGDLIDGAQAISKSNESKDPDEIKKVLIVLDEMHFQMMPYLQKTVYLLACEYNEFIKTSTGISIKLIVLNSKLNERDRHQWNSISLFKRIPALPDQSLLSLTVQLVDEYIPFDEQKKFLVNTNSDKQVISSEDDGFDDEFDDNDLADELGAMLIKIKNVFKDQTDANLRIYYHLIETFRQIFNREQTQLSNKRQRLSLGIQRLEHSGQQVQILKDQAGEQEKQLTKKRQEAEQALNMITSSMNSSEAHQVEIEEVRTRTQKETENIERRRKVVNDQLSKIEPQLKAANQAINSIKIQQLNEVRALRAPPETIRDILEAVLRLLGNLDTSWNAMKSFLGRRGVKEELLNFNCRKVSKENLAKVQELINNKPTSFTEAAAKRASTVAYPLANWSKSVVAYSTVLQEIEPLETELNRLQSSLQMAEMRISSLNTELRTVGDVVNELKLKLNQTTLEAAEIEVNYKKTKQTLETSQQLVGQLGDEYTRWSDQLKEMDRLNQQLIVNSLLASVYITFCMNQSSIDDKETLIKKCADVLEVGNRAKLDQIYKFLNGNEQEIVAKFGGSYLTQLVVDPGNLLVNQIEQLNVPDKNEQHEQSRPETKQSIRRQDRLKSTSMGQLQSAMRRQQRSVSSLHSSYSNLSGKPYEQLDMLRPDFAKQLELCIRFGKTAVLNDYYAFDYGKSSLTNDILIYSLFKRDLFGAEGARQWIRLGNKKIDLNSNFKLYLTKSYMPKLDSCSKSYLTLINLMPNSANTELKFLSLIIQVRKPELEKRKLDLEQEQKIMNRKLQELEDELLIKLNDSTGNLLEDRNLIESLKQTKQLANEISNSLNKLQQLSEQLEKERNQFKPLAQFASTVYFRLKQLKSLNSVYQLGINEFEQLFTYTLKKDLNLNTNKLLTVMFRHYVNTLLPVDQKVFAKYFVEDDSGGELGKEGTLSLVEYVENNQLCLEHRPILILTSPGVNPLNELKQLVDRLDIKNRQFISLSSDLLLDTERKIQTLYQQGESSILCISNLHLYLNWLPKLARLCLDHFATLQSQSSKRVCLIVLISETEADMPINLVELCSKFTYQPPTGLQAQLNSLIEQSTDLELVQFAYLHVICSERRKYIPIGWLKYYEFGLNEYQTGLNLIRLVRSQLGNQRARSNQKEFINGFIYSIVYGAKLDTDFDLKILRSLVDGWLNNESAVQQYSSAKATHLSAENETSLLGLSPNILKWYESTMSNLVKQKLLMLTSQLNESSNQELNRLIKLVQDLQLSKCLNALSSQAIDDQANPISIAINIQLKQAHKLGERILRTFEQPDKEDLMKLSKNETPDSWSNSWELGSSEADRFIRKFHRLISNFMNANQLNSLKFNLDQVLNPSALFNAIKQQAARQLNITMDKLEMKSNWNSSSLNGVKMYKISICGLCLVGAQLSGSNVLKKCQPDSDFKYKINEIKIDYLAKVDFLLYTFLKNHYNLYY